MGETLQLKAATHTIGSAIGFDHLKPCSCWIDCGEAVKLCTELLWINEVDAKSVSENDFRLLGRHEPALGITLLGVSTDRTGLAH